MPQHQQPKSISDLPVKDPSAYQALLDALPTDRPVPPDIDENGNIVAPGNAPRPASLQPDPQILGRDTQLMYRLLTRKLPGLKGGTNRITEGPTAGTIEAMVESGLHPEEFEYTTLDGTTDHARGNQVAINPAEIVRTEPSTLLHELGHTKGYDEKGSQVLEELLARMMGKQTPNSIGGTLSKVLPKMDTQQLSTLLAASKGRR